MSEKYTDEIVEKEFELFGQVNNEGGRASCQDDWKTFQIMRGSQFDAWNEKMRESYLDDLKTAEENGHNLVMEKYAYMSGYDYLGDESDIVDKQLLVMKIMNKMHEQTIEMRNKYPNISRHSRPMTEARPGQLYPVDSYLVCELLTYSVRTLGLYWDYVQELEGEGKDIPTLTMENTMLRYGFKSLEEADARMA